MSGGIELRFEGDGVIGELSEWLRAKTEDCDRLNELFKKWYETRGEWPYGALEFLAWLGRLGVKVEGPHWSGKVETHNTANSVNWLDEYVHYTIFKLGDEYFVAVSGGGHVHQPDFYKITADEPEDFLKFDQAWMECEAGHAFETENTFHWQFYVEGVGPRGPKHRLYDLDRDGDGDLLCPKCTNKIKKVGA